MKTLLLAAALLLPVAARAALDTAKLEALTGMKGALDAKSGVFKVSYPRKDLASLVDGVRLTPPMGLTAWAAFTPMGDHAMVMGDLVLLEDQVNPVMSAALDAGLEVTALHNHFLRETPRVMFMHVGGMGDEETLGKAVGKVFAALKAPVAPRPKTPAIDPGKGTLDAAALDAALGAKGQVSDGVYKVVFGLSSTMGGTEIGAAMGVNTWAAFAGGMERAAVDGDFAVYENQLQPVLRSLRKSGVEVAAIHSHMAGETPRVLFLHYWATGKAADLARAVRGALDAQAAAK